MSWQDVARSSLEPLGFGGPKSHPLTLPVDAEWAGWLGLSAATKYAAKGTASILPIVGVIHFPTEALMRTLHGEPPATPRVATVLRPMGDLENPRQLRDWLVGGPDDQSADLADAVRDRALPFIRSLISLEAVLDESKAGNSRRAQYVTPAVLMQLGRVNEGAASIQQTLGGMVGRTDAAAQRFRSFAASYMAEAEH